MVDVTVETVVKRPRADVAAFMFDPHHDTEWTTGITGSRPAQDGRLAKGHTVVRTAKFLGRTFDYEFVVLDSDSESFVHMKVDRPFPMQIRYELEDRGDETLTRIHTWGEPGGFFKLAAPLMTPKVRKSISSDLAMLKRAVESR